MVSPNSSPDQEKQGEQQPNELPILNEKEYVLLLLRVAKGRATMVSQRIRSRRVSLTNGGTSFQPILKVLADLERDDPSLPFQLLGLFDSTDAYGRLKTVPLFPQVRTSLLQDLIALVNLLDIDVLGNAYFGDRAISTHLKGASRPWTRRPKFAFPAARLVRLYSCYFFVLRRGELRWSAKEFEAEGFHLPMEGHDLKVDKIVSPNSSPDQEKQGEEQPNELPILNEKDHNLSG
jgi:hypothetical protein